MSLKDLLITMVEPDREISDQYRNYVFELNDGTTLTGRIINLNENSWYVNPDMRNPGQLVEVNTEDVERLAPSKTSTMPAGLLDTLTADEIQSLMGYLMNRDAAP